MSLLHSFYLFAIHVLTSISCPYNYSFIFYSLLISLFLSLILRNTSHILCRAAQVVRNSFSLIILWKAFLSPSAMAKSYTSLCWHPWSIRKWSTLPRPFSILMFSLKNWLLFWWFLFICDLWFFSYSFQYIAFVLHIQYFNYNMLWGIYMSVWVWVYGCECRCPVGLGARSIGFPGTEVTRGWELLGSPWELYVLWTAEPPLQSVYLICKDKYLPWPRGFLML